MEKINPINYVWGDYIYLSMYVGSQVCMYVDLSFTKNTNTNTKHVLILDMNMNT